MIVTNGTDPDLEQYFAFGSEKLKIADNFDEISRTDIYPVSYTHLDVYKRQV